MAALTHPRIIASGWWCSEMGRRFHLPLWPMLSFFRIYQLHFYYLPSPYRQCASALCPARICFSSYCSFAGLSSELSPSFPTFRIQLCVCIFAASSDFSLYGNGNKAGKWYILGSTSRGWEHPEREGEGQFLYKEVATLSSFKLCRCQPDTLYHSSPPHSCCAGRGFLLALGILLSVRAAGPWSRSSGPVLTTSRLCPRSFLSITLGNFDSVSLNGTWNMSFLKVILVFWGVSPQKDT